MRILSKIVVFCLLACFLPIGFSLRAQNTLSAPYSKYGIGDMNLHTNAINSAMGGVGYAMQRNYMVNYKNPASYAAVDTTSFVFDIGFYTDITRLSTSYAHTSGNEGGFSHILFAFPVHKTLKIAGGLLPVSVIDFSASEENYGDTATAGYNKTTYAGDGGVNKVFLGLAFRPTESAGFLHNLSVGVNVSYLFGNYYRSKTISFPDSAYFLGSRVENNYKISAFTADFGLQYFQPLKNGDRIGIGLTYALPAKLPTDNEYRHYTFLTSGTKETVCDSVSYKDEKGDIRLPQTFGAGVSYERQNKFFIAADGSYTTWSDFENQGISYGEVLKDSYRLNFGAEYKPDAYGNYLQKISYRVGFNYTNGELYLRSNRIASYGVALGFGLPIKKQGTQINISLEYGKQGMQADNLIEKNYFRIGLSLSAKDVWFFKRKYQ